MRADPPALEPGSSLSEAVTRLDESSAVAAPVIEGGRLIGILCLDSVRAAGGNGAAHARVRDWMVHHPETIDSELPLDRAATLLLYSGLDHLPVTERERVVGMLSRSTLEGAEALTDCAPRGV